MGKVTLKSGKRNTTISRSLVKSAVILAYAKTGTYVPKSRSERSKSGDKTAVKTAGL